MQYRELAQVSIDRAMKAIEERNRAFEAANAYRNMIRHFGPERRFVKGNERWNRIAESLQVKIEADLCDAEFFTDMADYERDQALLAQSPAG